MASIWKELQQYTPYGVAGAGALGALYLFGKHVLTEHKDELEEHLQLDKKLDNNTFLAATLVKELSQNGIYASVQDLKVLLGFAFTGAAGKPINDRELTMEKLMQIVTKLPEKSRARKKLTDILIKGLWDTLDHPPLSYHGPKYEYRTADGSYNNILIPHLGAAGSPYARSVLPKLGVPAERPDPGALFDALMARSPETFRTNEAGLSVMLFYHASIIIHDIFRTNRWDSNISDTSSYVDLAPLYGSSIEDNATVRSFDKGLLKTDTFFEERLLALPAGVNVLLVMYNRFHNYVAEMLLKINEGGRFSLKPCKPGDEDKAKAQQDEDLFQTARLVTCGLYANIALHDYLRGLTNTHHSASSWTMDPRWEIDKGNPIKAETPRGIGNQVSTEFNMLYRFHSAVSQKDEQWLIDFYHDTLKISDIENAAPRDILVALTNYENSLKGTDPSKREFGGLKRGENGRFSDAEMAKILHENMNDPAGAFGARNVPKSMKVIEILGIKRAREWKTATLNEFREYFGLERHKSFESINTDPEIADLLRAFYETPDRVEAYPGMWIEDAKPAMAPGSGVCLPWTVGRAVFSDAITLVRSDRFYTIDFTPATLTNWGLNEVVQDYKTLGGSVFYKLIQRGLPGWFPFNSINVMQPMFTGEMNKHIAEEIGTIKDFNTKDGPRPPPAPKLVLKYWAGKKILNDIDNFAVPGLSGFPLLADGHDYSDFMLCGDKAANLNQRKLMDNLVYRAPDFGKLVFEHAFKMAEGLVKTESLYSGKVDGQERFHLDIISDVAIPTLERTLADIFCADLKTEENPEGSYEPKAYYKDLLTVWVWIFSNIDPARSWNRRREARDACARLRASTKAFLKRHLPDPAEHGMGFIHRFLHNLFHVSGLGRTNILQGSLRWYGLQVAAHVLQATGDYDKMVQIMFVSAIGGGGLPIGQFGECFSYFMQNDQNVYSNFKDLQKYALANTEEGDHRIEGYMNESFRLSNHLVVIRIAKKEMSVDGNSFKPGDVVAIPVGVNGMGMDPEGFPEPATFNPSRPKESYLLYGDGPHYCFGKEISQKFTAAMLKVACGLQKVWLSENAFRRVKAFNTDHYISADGTELSVHPSSAKITYGWYTRDIKKTAPPIYPVTNLFSVVGGGKPQVEVSQEAKDKELKPSDIAAELKIIDKQGTELSESERSWVVTTSSSEDTDMTDIENGVTNHIEITTTTTSTTYSSA